MPARKLPDVGAQFGSWTFLGEFDGRKWHCQCACGAQHWPNSCHLRSGASSACRSCSNTSHGQSRQSGRSRLYVVWCGVKTRCLNSHHSSYPGYGGRGITLSPDWLNFLQFAQDVGAPPSATHTIERIDNSSGYEKGNTRWALPAEQARNRRDNHWITIDKITLCATDWCRLAGITLSRAHYRVNNWGWSWEEAVTTTKNNKTRIT